jgi:hypothetical protein
MDIKKEIQLIEQNQYKEVSSTISEEIFHLERKSYLMYIINFEIESKKHMEKHDAQYMIISCYYRDDTDEIRFSCKFYDKQDKHIDVSYKDSIYIPILTFHQYTNNADENFIGQTLYDLVDKEDYTENIKIENNTEFSNTFLKVMLNEELLKILNKNKLELKIPEQQTLHNKNQKI